MDLVNRAKNEANGNEAIDPKLESDGLPKLGRLTFQRVTIHPKGRDAPRQIAVDAP